MFAQTLSVDNDVSIVALIRTLAYALCSVGFAGIDWVALEARQIDPPFKPTASGDGATNDTDASNFDTTFTSEPAVLTPPEPSELVSFFCQLMVAQFLAMAHPF